MLNCHGLCLIIFFFPTFVILSNDFFIFCILIHFFLPIYRVCEFSSGNLFWSFLTIYLSNVVNYYCQKHKFFFLVHL